MGNDQVYYDIPVPDDLESITAIHDGTRWLRGVVPGSVQVGHGAITFVITWGESKRRFTLATDLVGGYQSYEQ